MKGKDRDDELKKGNDEKEEPAEGKGE